MGKPSQTTGYHVKSIYLTDYSTGGQYLVASSGSEVDIEAGAELEVAGTLAVVSGGKVEMDSGSTMTIDSGANLNLSGKLQVETGGEIELKAGSTFTVESGGCINLTAGAIMKHANFEIISSSKATLSPTGISVIKSTVKGDYQLAQPAAAGYEKTIVFLGATTAFQKVRVSPTSKSGAVYIGSSIGGSKMTTITAKSSDGSSAISQPGQAISLLALSTAQWVITNIVGRFIGDQSASTKWHVGFLFSSST